MSKVGRFLRGKLLLFGRLKRMPALLRARQTIDRTRRAILGVPVRVKISGMVLLPVLILGAAVAIFVRASLADWLTWVLDPERVGIAMETGSRSILVVTALAALAALMISSLLMLLLTTPILELRRVADLVRAGAIDQRARIHFDDEIGQVAESFNRMLDELVASQRQLEQSNRQLGALCHVATSVGRGLELGNVLQAALLSTLEVTGLESGWIYLKDPESGLFDLASAVNPPQVVADQSTDGRAKVCGCQQALLDDGSWSKPVQRACRRLAPSGEGFGDLPPIHLSVPLRARGLRLGVLNLLWSKPEPPKEEEQELLDALGVQVSEALANARLHADLQIKEAGMENLLHSLVTAQEDERSLISSELHDGAGQELTSVLLRLKSLESKQDVMTLQQGVSDLCIELSQAIEHIRGLSHQLRPPDLDQLGLAPTLRILVADMLSENGMHTEVHCDLNGTRLDSAMEICLYRIAQEALTNIVRHADASAVNLSLQVSDTELRLRVEDDGRGFDPDHLAQSGKSHIGLASIQERAERLGGMLEVETGPELGTRLTVTLPRVEVRT